MDEWQADTWRRSAKLVLTRFGRDAVDQGDLRVMLDRIDRLVALPDNAPLPVSRDADPTDTTPTHRPPFVAMLTCRAIAIGRDVALREGIALPPDVAEALSLPDRVAAQAVGRRRDALPGETVRAIIPYAYGGGGPMSGRFATEIEVPVVSVDVADVPVVARLRAGDGTWLGVRSHAGGYIRPVLAPETWRPIDIDDFKAACSGRTAWADPPFVPDGPHDGIRIAPLAYLATVRVSTPGRRAAVAEARATALAGLGAVFAVEGIVHVPTTAPALRLGSRTVQGYAPPSSDRTLAVTWTVDGLDGLSDMATLARRRVEWTPLESLFSAPAKGPFGRMPPRDAPRPAGMTFPITALDRALAVLTRFDGLVRDGTLGGKPASRSYDLDLVESVADVDPLAFPGRPTPALDALQALLAVPPAGAGDDAPWRVLARMVAAGDGAGDVDEALAAASAAARRRPAWTADGLFLALLPDIVEELATSRGTRVDPDLVDFAP